MNSVQVKKKKILVTKNVAARISGARGASAVTRRGWDGCGTWLRDINS